MGNRPQKHLAAGSVRFHIIRICITFMRLPCRKGVRIAEGGKNSPWKDAAEVTEQCDDTIGRGKEHAVQSVSSKGPRIMYPSWVPVHSEFFTTMLARMNEKK
jgi:hypothetical protein